MRNNDAGKHPAERIATKPAPLGIGEIKRLGGVESMNETRAVSAVFLGSIALMLNVSVVPAVEAQTTGDATAGDTGDALQEIIVTAEKRPEEAQRIAISIS